MGVTPILVTLGRAAQPNRAEILAQPQGNSFAHLVAVSLSLLPERSLENSALISSALVRGR